jgi:trans-aconitate 2-methyltransferase
MDSWNPEDYLKFRSQRTQPSLDLTARIRLTDPRTIIDIGSGPGNSTQVLARKWPRAEITGLDSSEAMIRKARKDFPALNWVLGKAENLTADRKYTLVYSNAALQWVPDHEILIPKLWNMVEKGGALAVQIPNFEMMDINTSIQAVLNSERWNKYINVPGNCKYLHDLRYYYDLLSSRSNDIELWETHYYHILPSHESIISFIESTALKVYLSEMPDRDKIDFKKAVLDDSAKYYPELLNGNVFFPFKRLFFTAYNN